MDRLSLVFLTALFAAGSASGQDSPVVTGGTARPLETREALRAREALAYAQDLPPGAPIRDYSLVAWCDALVSGHVALGESLNTADPLDLDIIRLGRIEAESFRAALKSAEPRQSAAVKAEAGQARARAEALWAPLKDQPLEVRSTTFGLFFGLPGRCEHAARRIRDNITTPPATLKDVGLEPAPGSSPAATPPAA